MNSAPKDQFTSERGRFPLPAGTTTARIAMLDMARPKAKIFGPAWRFKRADDSPRLLAYRAGAC
jgi:hypothetical protein